MSLYREAGGIRWRRLLIATAAALVIGLGIGFGIGRSTAPEPGIGEQLAKLQDRVQPVMSGIELVPDHYAQAVRDGEVVGQVQYSGTQQQAAAAEDSLAAVAGDLERLDPGGLAEAQASLGELSSAIDDRRSAERIEALAQRAAVAVASAAGLDDAR